MNGDGAIGVLVDATLPVVLTGGESRRFGRDKLREPWCGSDGVTRTLAENPVRALRAVFGARVCAVGACHTEVAALADKAIADESPGAGPIAGIVAALIMHDGPVFVLAGDMPEFGEEDVRTILRAGASAPGALAVLAWNDRVHPCAGLYRPGALTLLQERMTRGEYRLHDALPAVRVTRTRVSARATRNINHPPGAVSDDVS